MKSVLKVKTGLLLLSLALLWQLPVPAVLAEAPTLPGSSWAENYDGVLYSEMNSSLAKEKYATEDQPLIIETAQQLAAVAKIVNEGTPMTGKYIRLDANLDLSAHGWQPIGMGCEEKEEKPRLMFNGVFEGSDHVIGGVSLEGKAAKGSYGFFGNLGSEAQVRNLTLLDSTTEVIISRDASGLNVGHLAGASRGSLDNCYVQGSLKAENTGGGSSFHVGALVGWNQGKIQNCRSQGAISAQADLVKVGGLSGFNQGEIIGSFNQGTVRGMANGEAIPRASVYTGGLVGWNQGKLEKSYNEGTVSGKAPLECKGFALDLLTIAPLGCTGGLVGYNEKTVLGCHNIGTVHGEACLGEVGGLVGLNQGNHSNSSIKTCYNRGAVSAKGVYINTGGLLGSQSFGNLEDCFNTAAVDAISQSQGMMESGNQSTGGAIGWNKIGKVNQCSNRGAVSGESITTVPGDTHIGGVAGDNSQISKIGEDLTPAASITACQNSGKVTALGANAIASDICAYNYRGFVENCPPPKK